MHASAGRRRARPHRCCSPGTPRAERPSRRRMAAELGDAHADLRDQLLAFAAMTAWFDDRAPTAMRGVGGVAIAVPGPGAGPGTAPASASVSAFSWANLPGPREACVELAVACARRAGHHRGRQRPDEPAGQPCVLAYAEHPDTIAYVETALSDAHRRGSLFAVAGTGCGWAIPFPALRSRGGGQRRPGSPRELTTWGFDNGPRLRRGLLVMALVDTG